MQRVFRELLKADREAWNQLWAGYLEFYEHELKSDQTELTWQRFFEQEFNLFAFVAEVDGLVVGIAHCSFTNSTWSKTPDLYLEDLFVSPEMRQQGLGEFLINGCADFALARGARRLYWQTHKHNETAQKVYRKVAVKSDFVTFEKTL